MNYSSITTDFTLRHSIHAACTETSFRRTYFYSSINFRMLICGFFFNFAVLEDDLSQSVKNGYLLLEDEIDHVSSLHNKHSRSYKMKY